MKKNSLLLLSMLLVLSVVLAACNFGGKEKDTTTKEDGTTAKELNLVIPSEPPTLHPGLATDSTSGVIIQNVFDGLTALKDGEVVNAVAEDVQISEDLINIYIHFKRYKMDKW